MTPKHDILKRTLSLVLALVMTASCVPFQAFAAETETIAPTEAVETTPAETTAPTEPPVPETVPETTAETTAQTVPETTEATVPETTEETVPEIAVTLGETAPVLLSEPLDLSAYQGKVISILGASTCTFAGYIPVADGFNLEHYARYPQDNLLTDVNDTWWMQVINTLDAKLGINDSWRSTEVYNACTEEVNSSYDGTKACLSSITRIQNLGSNGTPDVILFFGGINDITQRRPLGTFNAASAPKTVDLTTETWETVAEAYTALIMRLQYYYPSAKIVALLPYSISSNSNAVTARYTSVFAEICKHYGVSCIDLMDCGISTGDLPDGTHPNAEGMDYITEAVLQTLAESVNMEAGENVVYSVSHKLNGAKASLGYYKGVSAGSAFEETLDGEALSVTVTMGGKDITASAYANGKVSIPKVTGDLVITAKGIYDVDGRLQKLPDNYCCNTNLWTQLEPVNEYYTPSGWGNNSNSNYSVTFPVTAGDHIWATSFGAAGTNGYSANAVRITWFGENGVLKSLDREAVYGEFAEYGYLTVPEGAVALNIPMATNSTDWEIYILNRPHSYSGGKCAICGENAEDMSLRYDDHFDIAGKTVEIIDSGNPTSYQVGYGVAAGTLDTAVVTIEGNSLVATGIGTARVSIDGQLYEVTVTAAPISLILLAGQSNMQGSEGNADQSIICPDGQVYSTYGDRYTMTTSNATNFAPSALTGSGSKLNVNGTTTNLKDWPVYLLNEAGAGKAGPDSGFAYEWVKQTGEKVWIVNAAHGGTSINVWQKGTTQYEECKALFSACQETLRQEIAAGHYTLAHMGYFWCQGCTDYSQTAEWYVEKYLTMHENFKTELAFDHDSNASTEDKVFEFAGIIPVRAGNESYTSYRQGTYVDSTTAKYHESFKDLRFTGPRVAQYWMINNPDLPDIWGVCNIGEDWVWMPDGTNGVKEYFQAYYENGTVDYTTQVAQKEAWYTPTTPAAVHDSIHYNQIGYNEVGREAVRNALILLGEAKAPEAKTEVKLVSWDGFTEITEISAATAGSSGTLVVPLVSPLWKSKEVTYTLTDGLTYSYYDLLADSTQRTGKLTAVGADGAVSVVKQKPGTYFADHLSQLPEPLCCGVNLWHVLEHDKYFYSGGTRWDIHSSGTVYSVTIPVKPGDQIFATAFGKGGQNGHASSNGIRVTFFGEYDVVKTLAPADTYAEFTANGGYLVVPEGAVAMNIPMWNNNDDNELYILNLPHDTTNAICGICGSDSHRHSWGEWETITLPTADAFGVEQRKCVCGETEIREVEGVWQKYDLADHMQKLPAAFCKGTNLWAVMEHDPYYFASGANWGKHSSGEVPSVTIPVNPGDHIFATSFGAAAENGHGTSNGIRVTFFSAYGVAKTMDPAGTYAEFSANGGYLVAPEDAVAVNVPMWSNEDSNELYILNRPHSYEAKVTAPTCTEQGYTTHTCECGDSYVDDYVAAKGHNWGEWSIVSQPTCNAEGQDRCICNDCGTVKYRDTRISGDPNKIQVSNPVPENYFEGKTLMAIGDSLTNGTGVEKEQRYQEITARNLNAAIINSGTSGATLCPGGHLPNKFDTLMTESLLSSRNVDVVSIFLGVNDWNNGVVDGTIRGKLEYDASLTYYDLGEFGTDDTTTIYGAAKMWCERIQKLKKTESCKDIQFVFLTPVITERNRSVTMANDWRQDKTNVFGYTLRQYCTAIMEVCAYYEIPVLDLNLYSGMYYHSEYDNNVAYFGGDGIHPGVNGHAMMAEALTEFLLEGYTYENRTVGSCGHSYESIMTQPTCTTEGYTTHSCHKCYYSYISERKSPTGHSYQATIIAPTCTEQGYTTHTCTACGDSYVDTYVNATGHTYGTWTVTTAATCTANGTERRDCNNCDHYETREIAAKGYDWMLEDGTFKLLLIGNSFSEDASNCGQGMTTSQLLDILQAMLGEGVNIQIGLCYSGGKSMTWHATQAEQGNNSYSLRVIDSQTETWQSKGSFTSADALSWTDWDVVSIQPYGQEARNGQGKAIYADQEDEKFYPMEVSAPYLLDHVAAYAPQADVYYYMIWASTQTIALNAAKNSYDAMAAFTPSVLGYAGTKSGKCFADIIPVGASIQNARTTYLALLQYNTSAYADGNLNLTTDAQIGLQRDGGHLSFNIGRYIAALTFAETIIPAQLREANYQIPNIRVTESLGMLPNEYSAIAQKSVTAAVDSWKSGSLAVTAIAGFEEDPTVAAAQSLTGRKVSISCAADTADLQTQISGYVASILPADFKVDAVTLPESFTMTGNNQNFTATVAIRFGYTSEDVEITGTVSGGHSYGAWTVTTAATCTAKGAERRDCNNCDHYETREIAAKGHTEVTDKAVAATCTATGLTEGKHCSVCNTVLTAQTTIAATGHTYGTWTVTTAATCTAKGTERRDCNNCDHYETRELAAKGHTEVIDKAVAATCTTTGLTEGKHCSVCGTVLTAQTTVAAKGHTWDNGKVTKEPTEQSAGVKTYTCTTCGAAKTETIPALNHTHKYTDKVTAPTCTEQGYTTHTCTCGDSYVDNYVNATGHSYGTWTITTAATCTAKGAERRDCNNCDHYETREIAAKGHTEVIDKAVAATCTTAGLTEGKHCSVCGTVLTAQTTVVAKGHTWDNGKVTKEPTEETAGVKTFACTTCGATKTETIPALNHTHKYTDKVTAPTCTEKGYTTHTCTCGDSYVDTYVEARGHTEVIDKAVAATCTTTGLTEGKHCSVCGTILTAQKEVAALGHSWDVGVVTKDPTENEEGESVFTCQTCGETKTQKLPTLSHTHEYDSTVTPPTCTAQGYTTHTCSCGDGYVDSYVEATGHTAGEWISDKTGHWRICESCDEILDIGIHDGSSCTICGHETPSQDHGFKPGDVNHDGKINAKDSTLILQKSVGVLKPTASFCDICAEVSGDGRLNAKDATLILQYSVGLLTEFPAQQ